MFLACSGGSYIAFWGALKLVCNDTVEQVALVALVDTVDLVDQVD